MERIRPKWLKSTKGAPFTGIGSLEADILAVIWERKQATVRDVYETLREQRQIAYTTVMTVMNNLVKKELLTQDRTAIAYVYTPAIPGNEVAQHHPGQRGPAPVPRPVQRGAVAPARAQARPRPASRPRSCASTPRSISPPDTRAAPEGADNAGGESLVRRLAPRVVRCASKPQAPRPRGRRVTCSGALTPSSSRPLARVVRVATHRPARKAVTSGSSVSTRQLR